MRGWQKDWSAAATDFEVFVWLFFLLGVFGVPLDSFLWRSTASTTSADDRILECR